MATKCKVYAFEFNENSEFRCYTVWEQAVTPALQKDLADLMQNITCA